MKQTLIIFLLACPLAIFCQTATLTLQVKPINFPKVRDTQVEQWNQKQSGYTKLDNNGKEFFYWTNYSRINPARFWDSVIIPVLITFPQLKGSYSESLRTDLINAKGLPLFRLDSKLLQTAQSHASDISKNNSKPGHNSSDGTPFSARFKQAGLTRCGGENVSFGDSQIPFLLAMLYLDYNLPQLGHRKALLNPLFTEIGVGASILKNKQLFLVQDFACNQTP